MMVATEGGVSQNMVVAMKGVSAVTVEVVSWHDSGYGGGMVLMMRWWVWRWDQRCDHAGVAVGDTVVVVEVVVMPWWPWWCGDVTGAMEVAVMVVVAMEVEVV